MSGDALLILAVAISLVGVAVLRAAWSRPRRSLGLNGAGWGALLVGAACGWASAGAWGVAVAALWAMGAAFLVLAAAGLSSRSGKTPASNRRVGMLPEGSEPLRIAGRLFTFVLVAIVSALLAVGASLAASALGLWAGWGAADAYATAFFLAPLAWGLIAYAVLMQPARKGQFKVLAISSLPTWPMLATGILS
ncbi:hypothetical protein [Novosphingobium sp. BL-52-GroH]|uniref:hypothetical protein n=1 Tax=Novosphingobium sp. BL-52-GroH TaxID=3349877 RepID=UPI00384F4C62